MEAYESPFYYKLNMPVTKIIFHQLLFDSFVEASLDHMKIIRYVNMYNCAVSYGQLGYHFSGFISGKKSKMPFKRVSNTSYNIR